MIVSHFPAERIMDYDNFVSLLYYYGMLTIGGVRRRYAEADHSQQQRAHTVLSTTCLTNSRRFTPTQSPN
jgi:hypothetical protein